MPEIPESYEVHIGAFDGPMDLLLYLVQQSEVKPADISISEITDQYLEWMKDVSQADLSQAGDFLLMASRLMAMKVRELLPKDQRTEEEIEEFDFSRDELFRNMREYQFHKQNVKNFQQMESQNFGTCYRGRMEKTESDDTLADANIWQLFRAYQKMLKTHRSENVHHIELDDVKIEDRQQYISNTLRREGRVLFEDLLGRAPMPIVTVVTFMALMEMIKTDEVVFRQSELFGAIWIYRKKDNSEFAEEMANETRIFEPEHEYKSGILEKLRERELVRHNNQKATLDQVMRTASLLATRGRAVNDNDIAAMLNGEMDLSAFEAEFSSAAENESPQADDEKKDAAESVFEEEAKAQEESALQVENAEISEILAPNEEPPALDPSEPSQMPEDAEAPMPLETAEKKSSEETPSEDLPD